MPIPIMFLHIDTLGRRVDVMIEAKMKEAALLRVVADSDLFS